MSEQPDPSAPELADEVMQPSKPTTVGFILKLFLIPFAIVSAFVGVGLLLSRSAHKDDDLRSLVRDLRAMDEDSWHTAFMLSQSLRSADDDRIRNDVEICRELASILSKQTAAGGSETSQIRLRVFLCRALGEFRVDDGLPALLEAAAANGRDSEIVVRCAAIEAITVMAGNMGAKAVIDDPRTIDLLLAASREPSAQSAGDRGGELRSTAAFALGVVGGPKAIDRLIQMLDDPHPNVRYNAATGLARHGNARALPVLLEMLDLDNQDVVKGEGAGRARQMKRAVVLTNGLRAAVSLAANNPSIERAMLVERIQHLSTSKDVSARIRMDAKAALLQLRHITRLVRPGNL